LQSFISYYNQNPSEAKKEFEMYKQIKIIKANIDSIKEKVKPMEADNLTNT